MVPDPGIDIHLKITEKDLFFAVKNKISHEMAEDKDDSSGIGLKNVQRRLELLYPDSHQLEIRKENGWFIVTLRLSF